MRAQQAEEANRYGAEKAAVGFIALGCGYFFIARQFASAERETDPSKQGVAAFSSGAAGSVSPSAASRPARPPVQRDGNMMASDADTRGAGGEDLVQAFFNPFVQRWQRIPDGYREPAAMDLTAWHKRRCDPTEWSRLFAEGELSRIIPRGGLTVRRIPRWETYESPIVADPLTGKTVLVTHDMPARNQGQQGCGIQF